MASSQRVPPNNQEAEEALLCCILIHPEVIDAIVPIVRPEDFYRQANRQIYEAMIALTDRREPVDLVTLTDYLRDRNELSSVGGATRIAELTEKVPSAAYHMQYARVVREKSLLRRLITQATQAIEDSYREHESVEQFLDSVQSQIFDLVSQTGPRRVSRIGDLIMPAIHALDCLRQSQGGVIGVSTGLIDLDSRLRGLKPSDLIIIAARPSMGKTSLALSIARNVAVVSSVPVLIYSLETASEQLALRLVSAEGSINLSQIHAGYERCNIDSLYERLRCLEDAPIFIDDTPANPILSICATARRLHRERQIGLIIIDYIQLIVGTGETENRVQEVSDISRRLKGLARELDIPIIALSQLNRQVEHRTNKRPMLSDLRETGALEQDADVVIFIYRDEVYHTTSPDIGVAELIIGKNRNGPTGTVKVSFHKEYMRFANLERRGGDGTSPLEQRTNPDDIWEG